MNSTPALPPYTVPAGTGIGHVHLQVTDLDRALGFYRDLLGFEVTLLYGGQAAFLSAGATTTTSGSIPGTARAGGPRSAKA